jgi:hypothetical protein
VNIKVSDKLVCIDDRPGAVDGSKFLELGKVYVVSGINPHNGDPYIVGSPTPPSWRKSRFKKLDDVKKQNVKLIRHEP